MAVIMLVGLGGYGENYVKECLKESFTHKVAAVADPFANNSPFIEQIKAKGIPVFSSPQEAFDNVKGIELTVISSPIHTHFEYVKCALENHSNVLCEKPVVLSQEKLAQLEDCSKKSGCFVAVGYQLCYAKDLQILRNDVINGIFGKPVRMKSLRMMRRGDIYYGRNGWAGRLECKGEPVYDSPVSNACAHQIQNMLFLLGDSNRETCRVTSVEGHLMKAREDIENYDAASLKINTDVGVPLYYYTAHCCPSKKIGPMSVYEFEKATIFNDNDDFWAIFKDGSTKDYRGLEKGDRLQKLYDAIDCCSSHSKPSCTLEGCYGHTQVVLEAQKLDIEIRKDKTRCTNGEDSWFEIPNIEKDYLNAYEAWEIS